MVPVLSFHVCHPSPCQAHREDHVWTGNCPCRNDNCQDLSLCSLAPCYLSKASPKGAQHHSSSSSSSSSLHCWSLTSACWGHCPSLARAATALLLHHISFQATFASTLFDPAGSARTFLNPTLSSPFLWLLWKRNTSSGHKTAPHQLRGTSAFTPSPESGSFPLFLESL